jgi:hypothetical protein
MLRKMDSLSCLLLLLGSLLVFRPAQGQYQLGLALEATSHPKEFMFFEGSTFHQAYTLWPMLEARINFSQVVGYQKKWRWQGALNYRHTRLDAGTTEDLTFPDAVDPFYGFVNQSPDPAIEGGSIFETYHWLGLQAGLAYRFNRKKGWKNFWLGAGAMAQMPIAGYWNFGASKTSLAEQEAADFYNRFFFYGFYVQPSYAFNLSKNERGPWSLEVFGHGNLLFRNLHTGSPHFGFGGGLGLNYIF